jgi:aldehyde dehydrogenase (NAD+)
MANIMSSLSTLGALPISSLLTPSFYLTPDGVSLLATTLLTLTSLNILKKIIFPPLSFREDYAIDTSPLSSFKVVGKKSGVSLPLSDVPQLCTEMRAAFNTGHTLPLSKRIEQLTALKRLFVENEEAICAALKEDLRRPEFEAIVYDTLVPIGEISEMIHNLSSWAAPEPQGFNLLTFPSSQWLQKEPLGLILVIGSWNYPFMLSLIPLAGAIAAGNTAILKPCNVSSASAKLQVELVEKYLDPNVVSCVGPGIKGDRHTTAALLENKFDTIFFTGSPDVGKVIAAGAAQHLTPCILELGGKNPVFVDKSADVSLAAKRTVWGRNMNTGQQCISPDFVLVHESVADEFCDKAASWINKFYDNKDPKESKNFGRIVGDAQVKRISGMLANHGGKVICGGQVDAKERYIAPSVIRIGLDSEALKDETFGPILWVVSVKDMDEAVRYQASQNKPLSMYIFSNDDRVTQRIVQNTSAGGVTVNGTLFHCGHNQLPFGGVGNSGSGAYHGKATFDCFSHKKPVLSKSVWMDGGLLSDPFFLYAPWTDFNVKVMRNFF